MSSILRFLSLRNFFGFFFFLFFDFVFSFEFSLGSLGSPVLGLSSPPFPFFLFFFLFFFFLFFFFFFAEPKVSPRSPFFPSTLIALRTPFPTGFGPNGGVAVSLCIALCFFFFFFLFFLRSLAFSPPSSPSSLFRFFLPPFSCSSFFFFFFFFFFFDALAVGVKVVLECVGIIELLLLLLPSGVRPSLFLLRPTFFFFFLTFSGFFSFFTEIDLGRGLEL
mmetsp:Transcript_16583/g.29752  ORF Transcript_16583/g.29752 Transcript_16583/m.29752 type:complete len:220 (-) Transcript_16583:224-883(-)